MDVPVNPVWPYEPIGNRSPRLLEKDESMSQGLENVFTREGSESLAAQPMHNFAHQDEIDVAVNEAESGTANRFIDQGPVNARIVTAPDWLQIEIRPQAGEMRHQIADGN